MVLLGLLYIPTLARLTYISALAEVAVQLRRRPAAAGRGRAAHPVLRRAAELPVAGDRAGDADARHRHHRRSRRQLRRPRRPAADAELGQHAVERTQLPDLTAKWWLSVFPGAAISLTVVAFNLLGDGLRDRFDPRHSTTMGYAT